MLAVWPAARDAAVSGSTGIEGNPLDPGAVAEVLAGAAIHADADHIREVENYDRALSLARDAAAGQERLWSGDQAHRAAPAAVGAVAADGDRDRRPPRLLPAAGRSPRARRAVPRAVPGDRGTRQSSRTGSSGSPSARCCRPAQRLQLADPYPGVSRSLGPPSIQRGVELQVRSCAESYQLTLRCAIYLQQPRRFSRTGRSSWGRYERG